MAKWDGRERLLKRLAAMPPKVRAEVSAAIRKGAADIVEMQKRLVPVRRGDLKRSIRYEMGSIKVKGRGILSLSGGVGGDPDLTATVIAGNDRVFWARLVEFGTRPHSLAKKKTGEKSGRGKGAMHPGTRPQPFFYGPYRALKRSVKSKVTRAMKKAITS